MSPQRFAVASFLAVFLAAAPPARSQARPADPDIIAGFLLRSDAGARSFVAAGADETGLNAAARAWAAADPRRASGLAAVATPGSSGERRLIQALSRWTGAGRIAVPREKAGAAAFLEDAAAQAEKLLGDRAVVKEIEAAVAAGDQSEAIGRARALSGQKLAAGFEPSRGSAGAIGGSQGPAGAGASRAAAAGGAANDPAAVAANAAKLPSVQRPKSYSTPLAPPPLDAVQLSGSDRAINKALSVVNMESFSRGNTLNRESAEGTQASICKYLKKANYDPDQAWGDALAARQAPGADPGDLDLRNTEHYLYAYSTTAKPNGWGDSTPVQLLMAVGWTPFKTVTKHVRPTSTPSFEEAKWGVKGAWHGQHPPDWRSICEGKSKTVVASR